MFKKILVAAITAVTSVVGGIVFLSSSFEEIDNLYAQDILVTEETTPVSMVTTTVTEISTVNTVTTTIAETAVSIEAIAEEVEKSSDEEEPSDEEELSDEEEFSYEEESWYDEESSYDEESWYDEESSYDEEYSYYEEPSYGSDTYLLAYAMSREAAYGDYTDATYVANVILNRVDDPDFPDTVLGVLEAEGQYPWNISYYPREDIYDTEFFRIAENLLAGDRPLPSTVVYQAQFVQGSEVYCTLGVHYYCYK